MAVVVINLSVDDAKALPNVIFPTPGLEYSNGAGSATAVANLDLSFPVPWLNFTRGVVSSAYWQFNVAAIGTGNPPLITVYLDWFSPSVTTGTFTVSMQMGTIYGNLGFPVLNKALGTATLFSTTASTPVGTQFRASAVPDTNAKANNFQGFASGANMILKVTRDGVSDAVPSDFKLRHLLFTYPDT